MLFPFAMFSRKVKVLFERTFSYFLAHNTSSGSFSVMLHIYFADSFVLILNIQISSSHSLYFTETIERL